MNIANKLYEQIQYSELESITSSKHS